jgi:hypothetical protein
MQVLFSLKNFTFVINTIYFEEENYSTGYNLAI